MTAVSMTCLLKRNPNLRLNQWNFRLALVRFGYELCRPAGSRPDTLTVYPYSLFPISKNPNIQNAAEETLLKQPSASYPFMHWRRFLSVMFRRKRRWSDGRGYAHKIHRRLLLRNVLLSRFGTVPSPVAQLLYSLALAHSCLTIRLLKPQSSSRGPAAPVEKKARTSYLGHRRHQRKLFWLSQLQCRLSIDDG